MIKFICALLILITSGCGVKGRPQPPLTPPMIGRGEPNLPKATEKVRLPKKKNPKSGSADDDWNESDDFLPSEEN